MISEDLKYIIELVVFLGLFNGAIFIGYSLYQYYSEKRQEKWEKENPDVILPD